MIQLDVYIVEARKVTKLHLQHKPDPQILRYQRNSPHMADFARAIPLVPTL